MTLGSVTGDLASRVSVDSTKSGADATIATGEIVTVTLLGPRAFAHEMNTDFAVYHVLLSGPVNADVQVDVATSEGTATGCDGGVNSCSGGQTGDYVNVSDTLTIGPSRDTQHNANDFGVTWYTVFVYFVSGSTGDADETFTISLSNLRGGGTTPVVLGNSSVTTTIKSNPLAFSVSGPEFVDEGTKARFIVTRNVDLHAALGARVSYTTSDGTATAGTDYTAASGRLEMPITAYPNVPTVEEVRRRYSDWEVLVPVTADNVDESDETFSLTLSNPQTYFAGVTNVTASALGTATATTTIRDRAMVVSVSGPDTVTEGGNADFTVSLSRAPTANLTVNYQTYNALSPLRSATAGEDYTAQSGTLTFVPGETSKRVRVPILTDSTTEPVEYFRLLIASPSGGGGLTPTLGTSEATMGIVDAAGPLYGATLTLTPASSIGEDDTSATEFTVKVDLDCCTTFDDPITVTMSLGGTATVTDDYTATTVNVTIPASTATATATTKLSITPVDDGIVEGDETIIVNGSAPGLAIIPSIVTLTDNDENTIAATGIRVSGPETVMERGVAIYTVSLSPKGAVPLANLTVDYATSDGSDPYLGPAAVAGTDYTTKSGTLTFTPTDAGPKTVVVPILEDTVTDSGEYFTFSLSNLQGGGTPAPRLRDDEVTTVILDANKDITLTANRYVIGEDENAARITLTATRSGTEGEVTITSDLPPGGTATPGALGHAEDYVVWSRWRITIPDGASSASTRQALGFTMTDDDFEEGDETIIVNGRATGGLTVAPVVLTVIDNDRHDIKLTANRYTIQESEIAARVTLTATREGTEGAVTITGVLPPEGTAEPGALGDPQDYVVWSRWSITIPDGSSSASTSQALGFTMTDDSEVEGDETIILKGTAPGLSVSPVVLTVGDNDREDIVLSASPDSMGESDDATSVTVTATLSGGARSSETVVSISALSGTATEDSDYTATSLTSITIPANSASGTGTFTVTPVSDYLSELDETIWVEGTTTGGLTVGRAVLTIEDEYVNNIELSVSLSSIAENAGATEVTVTATRETARDVDTVVKLSLSGTAEVQDDYTAPMPVTITIPANQTTGTATLTVTPVHDALDESDETIRLYGTAICHTVSTADITLTNVAPAAPVISFETAPTSVVEGQTATYVVKLEGSRTTDVTVKFQTADGLAVAGQDYTAVDTTLTFTPTESTKTVTVTTLADTKFEVTEDFTVTLSNAQGGGGQTPSIIKGGRTTTITDDFADDDAYPDSYTLTATPIKVGEGDGATQITFTATINDESKLFTENEVQVLVFPNSDRGTRVATEDYTISGHYLRLTFAPGEESASGTLTITPVDDDIVEDDENIVFTSHAGGGMTTSDEPTVTLEDNDIPPSITLSVSPSVLREGSADTASEVTVTATLNEGGTLPGAVDVVVSLADGTANSEDYSNATVTVTIPAGETSGSADLKVTVKDDDKPEENETLDVTGTAAPLTVHPAQLTILDDDSTRRGITLTVSPNRVREDAGATALTVTASMSGMEPFKDDAPIGLSLADGTATLADGDYSAATGTLTIPAGQLYGISTFTFTPTKDAVVESDETVLLSAALGRVQIFPATITIINTSHADLSISGPSAAVAEGANATFTVKLSAAIAEELSVAWSATPNTAVAADYSPASGSVTFPSGSEAGATQTFTVGMTDDMLSEGSESFTVTLGAITTTLPATQVTLKSDENSATATIAESDPITVSISGPSTVEEGDTTTAYTVSLSGGTPTADLTVDYSTSDGTATEGDDYDSTSGTLTFTQTAAGAQTFTLKTTDDTLDESDETFTVTLDDPTGGGGPAPSKHATQHSVTTTITDDDAATGITLSADPDTLEEDQETAETVTVTATLNGGTRTEATVVTIGTLAGSAMKDTDYTVTTALASITIPANSTSGTGTIVITPIDDKVVEGNETIVIPGTTTVSGLTVTSATITMKDLNGSTDDPNDEDKADLLITGPTGNVSEGSNATFTVTLSAGVASEVQVAWSAPLGTDAAEAADLGTTSGTLTFPANSATEATQDITITATDDMLSEGAEKFTVTLGAITTTLPATQVTLKDDDSSATATISASDPITVSISGPSSVDEGDATTDYTVSLSPDGVTPSADLTVSYGTANGTATAGTDYTAASGALTFTQADHAAKTFTVQTTEDSVDEGTGETFTVSISGPSGGGGTTSLGTDKSVTTTIMDDDDAPTGITLSASPNSLGEDDAQTSITVTATLDGDSTRTEATVVAIGTLAGSATKDTDYAVNTALTSITIPANTASGSGTLTIKPTDDEVVEGDEEITIPGTTTVSGLSVSSATVTLTDDNKTTPTPDDKDAADLSISGPSANVAEGASASFTVTLSKAVAAEVQVAWTAPLGTDAAEGSDLGATSGTVTFAANSAAGATQSITITATDDALSEGAEGFTVTLGTITSDLSDQVSLKSGSSSASATISASDPITVSISGPATVDEGDATSSYTVSLSPSGVKPSADLTVRYATADGTAIAGSDYTAKSGTLTFTQTAAGDKTFTVQTSEDGIDEGTGETFTVSISGPSGGGGTTGLGTDKSVTTTITDDDDAPTGITLSASPNSLGEDDAATSVTVTATLNGSTLPSNTVVTIGTLAGSATKDTDYSATSLASITILKGQTSGSGTLTITPTDDSVVEGDETIVIPGTTTTQVGLSVTSAEVTLKDHNGTTTDDPNDEDKSELSISGPSASVAEGSDATFTVTLSKAVAAEVQVAWTATGNTDDYSPTSGTVTFAANSGAGATQTITITATDDMLSETAESFTVTLGAITSDVSGQLSLKSGASSASATISASDPITVSISGPTTVNEGDATSSYTVSLSPDGVTPSADLTVSYATEDGTATVAGKDYTAKSGTLTFTNAASGSQTFTVQTTNDTVDEGTGETFTVSISSPTGGGGTTSLGTDKSVTTTITDDDDAPTGITLSASPNSLGEDDAATSVTVTATLNGSTLPSNTVVTIGTLAGSATKDTDYTATSLASITIPANTASGTGTLTITPTDDSVVEGDETITIPGTTTTQVGLSVTSAEVTLTDDNKTTTPTDDKDAADLSISGPSASVTEGSDATFTVTLSHAVASQVQVAWTAPLGTDDAEGSDLSATSGTVTFAANSAAGATQSITITTVNDALSETVESFTVTLGTITSDLSDQVSLKSGSSSASATIGASDPITVSISGPSSVDEGDATTDYTVSLSPDGVTPSADLTVSYGTANGTATAGKDYDSTSGTLTFSESAAGSQTFTVQTTDDSVDEGTGETFTVSISSPSGGGGPAPSLGTAKSVTTTITDDDDAPTGITLSASPNSLGEDDAATSVTVTATLGGSTLPSDTVVTIGTLAGSATKGTDYTATSLASITIPANTASGTGTLTITPTDDSIVEGDEEITIPGSTTVSGLSVSSATVTLTDDNKTTPTPDDDKDTATLSMAGPASNVAEGSDASFTVTLSHAIASQVQVAWSAPLGTDAAEAADLGTTSGTVTFAANSSAGATQDITITATDDKLSEAAESFTVTLGAITTTLPATQVTLKSNESSATATISASDPITISISGPSSVDEGDATTAYTVSLSPSGVTPTADLTVSYAMADGTATAGKDYTAKSGTLTFTQAAAGAQTFTVQTSEDTVDEGTGETFTVSISGPSGGGGATSLGTAKSVTTTITDDDDAPTGITLSASPNTLGEDDGQTSITITATLGGSALPTDTVVTIGTLAGSATKGTDYAVNTALTSITIPANTASGTGTLTITPTDDSMVEGDEEITIPGSTTVSGLSVSSATVTLTDDNKATPTPDDDKDTATLSIAGPASNVAEGSDASFTVTLSHAIASQVQVAWSAPLGTDAAEAADLGTTSGTVTFAANSAAGAKQSITITATDDMLSEGAESFTVTLGAITTTLPATQVTVKSDESSATATIAESDPITIEFSGPDTVEEGDTATYTVSLSPEGVIPTADLTVDYATSDGTATSGEDYTAASGTLTFTQTDHADKTVEVQTTDEILSDDDEDFTFSISSPSGGGGQTPTLGTSSKTTTINNDDSVSDPPDNPGDLVTPIDIRLSVSPNSVNEDNGETNFTVTATNTGTTRTEAMTIALALGGTADSSDYTAPAQASVTIPANQSSGTATLTLTMVDDDDIEGDETIIVGGSFEELIIGSALITVHDDEATYLSISGPTSEATEGSDVSFTVTLSKTVDADVTVAWTATAGTTEASDYGTASGSVTFAANSAARATQTITVAAIDDDLSETSETFSVELGADTGNRSDIVYVKSTESGATATIAASDPIMVELSGPDTVEEGDVATYTVSLSPEGVIPTADLTVDYATADGDATAGEDYDSTSGTLTFTQTDHGDKTVEVQTTEDILSESDEDFRFSISNPSGGGGDTPSLINSSSNTNITDDDVIEDSNEKGTVINIQLTVAPDNVNEDAGETNFTVTATNDAGATRTEDLTIALVLGGTADSSDYTAPAQASVTIPAGQPSGSSILTLTMKDDDLVEGDETIIVGGNIENLTVGSAVITVHDDEATYLSISGPTTDVTEGFNASFTVTLSKTVDADVTVAWTATAGTAEASDYGTASGSVTFTANSGAGAEQTITVTATDDDLSETSETFSVALGDLTSTSDIVYVKSTASSATATIAESDPITVNISGPSSVAEGDPATYTVSLSPSGVIPTEDLTVDYATADGTATAGEDYTAASGTLTFTPTDHGDKTVEVQTSGDSIDEGTGEDFTVSISGPSGGGGPAASLGTSSVTTTIAETDITLSASPDTLREDDGETNITVTATLNGSARASDTVVTIGTLSGEATAGTDYAVNTALASITIPANSTSATGTLTITPTDDEVVEGDDTILIPGTTTVSLTVGSATVTITDDSQEEGKNIDSAELSISGPSAEVTEGSDATFTVTPSKGVAAEVQVAWSAPLGTDSAEGSDLSATSGTVTFAADSGAGATQSITITATDDALSEDSESFTVTLGTITSDLSDQVSLKSGSSSATASISASDPITVSISGPSSVDEGDAATYTVSLSPEGVTPTADLTVSYTTSNGTATAGSDYTAAAGTLTFTQAAAGSQTIDVQTIEDTQDEPDENYTFALISATGGGGASTLGNSSQTTTITDDDDSPVPVPPNPDDVPPPPVPTPSPTATPTPEPTAIPTPEPTPVRTPEPTPVRTPEPTPVRTPEPTPVRTPEPTPVRTPEPTPVRTPEPTPVRTPEPTATLTPVPTAILMPVPTATPTPEATAILTPDYTATPTPTPEPARSSSRPKPRRTSTPSPTATPIPTPEPTVILTPEATATPTSEPTATPTAMPEPTTKTSPTPTPTPVAVTASLVSGTARADASGKAVLAYLSIAPPSGETPEGSTAEFIVALSRSMSADITVDYSVNPGTADATDYAASPAGAFTIAANSAPGVVETIAIPINQDLLSEGPETFTVVLEVVSGDLASHVVLIPNRASARATITESDPIAVSITGPATVNEGDAATYTVSLSPAGVTPTSDLIVDFATADRSAVAGSDYLPTSGTLTFTQTEAGVQTFIVQTTKDALDESDQSFAVTIENPAGAGKSSVITTIIDGETSAPKMNGSVTTVQTTTVTSSDDWAPTSIRKSVIVQSESSWNGTNGTTNSTSTITPWAPTPPLSWLSSPYPWLLLLIAALIALAIAVIKRRMRKRHALR